MEDTALISGLSCGGDEKSMRKVLKSELGDDFVSVELQSDVAKVIVAESVKPDRVIVEIEDVGFDAVLIDGPQAVSAKKSSGFCAPSSESKEAEITPTAPKSAPTAENVCASGCCEPTNKSSSPTPLPSNTSGGDGCTSGCCAPKTVGGWASLNHKNYSPALAKKEGSCTTGCCEEGCEEEPPSLLTFNTKESLAEKNANKRWKKYVSWMAFLTIVYNVAEGLSAVWVGAEEEAISLIGFGMDSFIEVFSAIVVLWRWNNDKDTEFDSNMEANVKKMKLRRKALEKERKATMIIGALLLALAAGASTGAILTLVADERPNNTTGGVIISSLSLSWMGFLYWNKMKAAVVLGSMTIEKDAACSLGCIQLSFVLLGGSLLFELDNSLWWVDGVTALIISCFIAKEGYGSVKAAGSPDFDGCGCCGTEGASASVSGKVKDYIRETKHKWYVQPKDFPDADQVDDNIVNWH